jgi:hypothetical protein
MSGGKMPRRCAFALTARWRRCVARRIFTAPRMRDRAAYDENAQIVINAKNAKNVTIERERDFRAN